MSDTVKITKSKIDALAAAFRSKMGTEEPIMLQDMIMNIEEIAKPKITFPDPGTYDANGNLLKTWAKVIEDGDLVIEDVFRTGDLYLVSNLEGDTPTRFANVSKVVIGSGVVGLHSYLFTNCSNLAEVVIPDGVKYIGASSYFDGGVFAGCSNLTTVRIPNSVEEIYVPAFANCTSLTEITIPDSVNYIDGMIFYGCTNLTTIHYSGTATGAPWGAENATVVP